MNFGLKSRLAIAALFAGAGTSFAADMAPVYKAPPAMPAHNWTGFYAGINAGYGVGRNPTTVVDPLFVSFETILLQPAGWLGGIQAGYNWQLAPTWVVGLEADIQASSQSHMVCVVGCLSHAAEIIEQKLPWFGTVRGRAGWANGPVLFYATGGLAYGSEKTTATPVVGDDRLTYGFPHNRAGWTAGGGIEAAVAPNWTAKAEYLYIDLGSATDVMPFGALTFSNQQSFRDNVFRLGLNYHPGTTQQAYASAAMPAPVTPYSWTGFYIGANTGYGVARNPTSLVAIGGQTQEDQFSLDPAGWLGGLQAGVNWQNGHWVVGLETDIQGQARHNSSVCVGTCSPGTEVGAQIDQKLPWFGTLRGRVGWAEGPALFYATGGLAYGKIETTVHSTNTTLPGGVSMSSTRSGWTIGGGIEGQLGGNWTAKAEYLYLYPGGQSGSYVNDPGIADQLAIVTTDVREHIFRVGLNYKIH